MKTWYLPPRFLDDVTLLQEYEDSYDYIHNRIIELQTFLRHKLLETEIRHRNLPRNGKIVDITPIPHNGVRPPKVRRV